MRLLTDRKAVSIFILILLILCSAVFGALVSYLFVMGSFYLEPETTGLVITDLNFPVDHADYFYITVMNPSNSPYGANITEIYSTVEGYNNVFSVTNTYPEQLPIPLEIGTVKTIRCAMNWGNFTERIIMVHVSAIDASGRMRPVSGANHPFFTEFFGKLDVETYFNATESIKYFNVSVRNNALSAINLTLTKVYLYSNLIQNMTVEGINVTLPMIIHINETINFQCFYDWLGVAKPLVRVETLEGYNVEVTKEVPSNALLRITDVTFNETNPNETSITLLNSPYSDTPVDITDIVLTYDNKTDHINGSLANPPLPYRLENDSSVTFDCVWNWTDKSYRDIDVTITAYTKQGFVSQFERTYTTPSQVVAKIADARFDLDDTEHFLVNVTNMPCSLYDINVTTIMLNQTSTAMNSSIIAIGNQSSLTCEFNWTAFVGKTVPITVNITYNENKTASILYNIVLPYIKIRAVTFSNFALGNPYVNITIYNSAFSSTNANITQIFIKTENQTYVVDGTITNPKISPQGYNLANGTEITVVCPWDWNPYLDRDVTVVIQTADGFQVSITLPVAYSPP